MPQAAQARAWTGPLGPDPLALESFSMGPPIWDARRIPWLGQGSARAPVEYIECLLQKRQILGRALPGVPALPHPSEPQGKVVRASKRAMAGAKKHRPASAASASCAGTR